MYLQFSVVRNVITVIMVMMVEVIVLMMVLIVVIVMIVVMIMGFCSVCGRNCSGKNVHSDGRVHVILT